VKCLTNKIRVLLVVILTTLSLVVIAQKQVTDRGNGTYYFVDRPSVEALTEYIKLEIVKEANEFWILTSIYEDRPNLLNLKRHALFSVMIDGSYLPWSVLPSSLTVGIFFTDGTTIGRLSGDIESTLNNIQSIFSNEQLKLHSVDPATLAEFFSPFICKSPNCSTKVISHESQLFKRDYTISYPRDKLGLIRDLQVMLYVVNMESLYKDKILLQSLIEYSLRRVDYAIWDKMISAESAEQYKADLIALGNGETIIDENPTLPYEITPPSLNQAENGDWILEFITLSGWMHETNTLTLQRITISSEFEITLEQELITDTVYAQMPEIMY